jgi:outer membrane lipoprotein-sorting protein
MNRIVPVLLLSSFIAGCAPKHLTLPSGVAPPFAGYAEAYAQATAECRGVNTLRATLSLSGRSGPAKLRGAVDSGFAAPSRARLEGRGPFGRPFFILVASTAADATLFLPRDNRVLRGAPPAAILEALAGVALGPDELRAVVAGCGLDAGEPSGGRSYENVWVAVDLWSSTIYLRQLTRRWQLVAATRGPVTVEYADFRSGRPSTIRLRTSPSAAAPATNLAVRLSDVDINVPLDQDVFRVDVPPDAAPLTLDELRRSGPLGTDR